ncbi:hypothetical protein SAMN06295920_110135 [Rhizorhabdus histidinilytica]|uniref:Uncharacterized protein n=2 Tax=Rhizorhabdus histidinilytica TaxID=439228 RepID=A0A1T5FQ67_9SPHN|nr:hypothetical protein SAMN06295920_110135 [Rhizorhabdus histidinilytica]
MDLDQAEQDVEAMFAAYAASIPADPSELATMKDGKLYELFVLAKLIDDLYSRGCIINFSGTTLKFKAGPGMIKTADPHFEVETPDGRTLYLFVDIEFLTMSRAALGVTDNSDRHELDIVLVKGAPAYPSHDEIVLGVECKSGAFSKALLKQALGVRREMSLLTPFERPSCLSDMGAIERRVRAEPASEFWVAHLDPAGSAYQDGPAFFGIDFRHIEP